MEIWAAPFTNGANNLNVRKIADVEDERIPPPRPVGGWGRYAYATADRQGNPIWRAYDLQSRRRVDPPIPQGSRPLEPLGVTQHALWMHASPLGILRYPLNP